MRDSERQLLAIVLFGPIALAACVLIASGVFQLGEMAARSLRWIFHGRR